jgi:hypothetical protein
VTRRELERRLEHWRERLVPEWRLTLKESGPNWQDEDDYLATVQADSDYHHAKVYFTSACLDRDEASIDVTIVHELLHLLAREMRRTLDVVKDHTPPAVHAIASETQSTGEEQLVERVAHAIVSADRGAWPIFGINVEGPPSPPVHPPDDDDTTARTW